MLEMMPINHIYIHFFSDKKPKTKINLHSNKTRYCEMHRYCD